MCRAPVGPTMAGTKTRPDKEDAVRLIGPHHRRNTLSTIPIRISQQLTLLVYELLDAHDDTARLAAGLAPDVRWEAHVGYLRDLQRLGREALALASTGPSS
jgi:hypothetical protein